MTLRRFLVHLLCPHLLTSTSTLTSTLTSTTTTTLGFYMQTMDMMGIENL